MSGLDSFKRDLPKYLESLPVKQETIRNVVTGNLYQAMQEEGKTKSDLAELLGVTKPAITSLLSGDRNFTIDKLTEIGHYLNRTPKVSFEKSFSVIKESWAAWLTCVEQTEQNVEIDFQAEKVKKIKVSQKTRKYIDFYIKGWKDSPFNQEDEEVSHGE